MQSTVCAFRCQLPDDCFSDPAFQSWSSWEHCLLTATFRATGSPFVRSIHHDGPPACRKSNFGLEDRTDFYKFHTNEPTTRSNHELKWEIPVNKVHKGMSAIPNYNFSESLSPLDFELLSKDLLEADLGISLENFKDGKDKRHRLKVFTFILFARASPVHGGLLFGSSRVLRRIQPTDATHKNRMPCNARSHRWRPPGC